MICEIRFITKNGKYDKTLAKVNRESDLPTSLRYAAAVYEASTPEEQQSMTSIRLRVLDVGEVPNAG